MKLEGYKDLWHNVEKSVEKNWGLDMQVLRQANLNKTSDKLKNLLRVKLVILSFFIAITAWLVVQTAENWTEISTRATLISFEFWTVMVNLVLIYEVYLIKKINYNIPLPVLLKRLSLIKLSTIRLLRLGTLILPFNTLLLCYYILLGRNLIEDIVVDGMDWIITSSLLLCILLSYWLFRKINPKNADKKWMYKLLRGNGSQVMDAMQYIHQVKELEQDIATHP